jgi:hypothetical protein
VTRTIAFSVIFIALVSMPLLRGSDKTSEHHKTVKIHYLLWGTEQGDGCEGGWEISEYKINANPKWQTLLKDILSKPRLPAGHLRIELFEIYFVVFLDEDKNPIFAFNYFPENGSQTNRRDPVDLLVSTKVFKSDGRYFFGTGGDGIAVEYRNFNQRLKPEFSLEGD